MIGQGITGDVWARQVQGWDVSLDRDADCHMSIVLDIALADAVNTIVELAESIDEELHLIGILIK